MCTKFDIIRCYNCSSFNHFAKDCTTSCHKCAEPHTLIECCSVLECCCNCKDVADSLKLSLDTGHSASSLDCPVYIRKVNAQRKRTNYANEQLTRCVSNTIPVFNVNNIQNVNPSQNSICIYYQNVLGLRTKTANLYTSSINCHFDIIVLTETWLNSFIYDSELFRSSDFMVHRCDRSSTISPLSNGGGVLIAVRANFHSEHVLVPNSETLEILFVNYR